MNLFEEPPTLDPRQARDTTSETVVMMLYEGLARLDETGEPRLAAAESYTYSPDGLVHTFRLRPAVWSNGDRVVAEDFRDAWAVTPHSGRPELLWSLYGVRSPSPDIVIVELDRPNPHLLHLLASPAFLPYHDGETNGPFQLESHVLGEKLTVVKSSSYWDAANVHLSAIEMCMVDDQKTELYMFQQGELDWAGRPNSVIPLDAVRELRADGQLRSHPVDKVYWYQFNPDVPPFGNGKVREAFFLAIDRERLIEHVTASSHRPATGFLPMEEGGELAYDPERARELLVEGLAELGLEECPPIVLSLNSGEDHPRIAQAVQQQWERELGVIVGLSITERRMHFDRIARGDYQVARFGWECAFPDGSDILDYFCRTYSLPSETTHEELLGLMPAAPLFFYTYDHLCNPDVQGIVFPSTGHVDFRWAHF